MLPSSSASSSSSFSYQQELTLALTPKCTASLSILCNLFILYECWCDQYGPRKKKTNAIHRAVLGMTCIDIMASLGWGLSSWTVPEGTFALAAGNMATCNFQGFLLQFAIGAPLYNCSLAMYYLLVIKYNWSNEMLYRIEQWTHIAILTFSIGTGIALLPLTQYNPIGNVCWVIGYPADCGHSTYGGAGDVPCERGDHAFLYGMALFYGPLWVCVIACILSMIMIYLEVRATHHRMERYGLNARGPRVHSLRRSQSDTSSVATQAILYSLSFFITWTPSTIWSIAHWFKVNSFWLNFASALCEPLQGFWNCMIFLRKRPASQEKVRILVHTIFPCWCKEPLHGGTSATNNSGHGNHTDGVRRTSGSKYSTSHRPDSRLESPHVDILPDSKNNNDTRESSSRQSFTNHGGCADGVERGPDLFEKERDHNGRSGKTQGDDDIGSTVRTSTNGQTEEHAGQKPFSPTPPLTLIDEERQQYKYYYPSADFDLRYDGSSDSSHNQQQQHAESQPSPPSQHLSLPPPESAAMAIESIHEQRQLHQQHQGHHSRNTSRVRFATLEVEAEASTITV